MKSNRTELAALARASGDHDAGDRDTGDHDATEVRQQVLNVFHPSHVPAKMPVMGESSPDIAYEELCKAMAILTGHADREAVRAAFWNRAKLSARRVAVMCAGMPKERADAALNTFDAFERGTANLAIENLIKQLRDIQRCMTGGDMPKTPGAMQ